MSVFIIFLKFSCYWIHFFPDPYRFAWIRTRIRNEFFQILDPYKIIRIRKTATSYRSLRRREIPTLPPPPLVETFLWLAGKPFWPFFCGFSVGRFLFIWQVLNYLWIKFCLPLNKVASPRPDGWRLWILRSILRVLKNNFYADGKYGTSPGHRCRLSYTKKKQLKWTRSSVPLINFQGSIFSIIEKS